MMQIRAQTIEILNSVLNPDIGEKSKIDRMDIIDLTSKGSAAFREISGNSYIVYEDDLDRLLINDELLSAGTKVKFRLFGHPRSQCEILYFPFEIVDYIDDFSPTLLGDRVLATSKAKVTAFNASNCVTGYRGNLAGFIIEGDEEPFIYLPKGFLDGFDGIFLPQSIFGATPSANMLQITNRAPPIVQKYFDLSAENVVVPIQTLKIAFAAFISDNVGVKFRTDELDDAIKRVYSMQLGRANLVGFNARIEELVTLSPIVFFIISWLMHRAAIQANIESKRDLWLATDVADKSGKIASFIFASTPFLLGVSCAIFYCASLQFTGVGFGYAWRISETYSFEFMEAPPRGWIHGNTIQEIFLGILWLPILGLNLLIYDILLSNSVKFSRSFSEKPED